MIENGAVLGTRYEVREAIARGGMAEVFRGWDRRLDRPVAIKAFRGAEAVDRERFAGEMRLLARLHHPHLIGLYDGGEHGDAPYLVLELADGLTLRDRLGAGPLSADQARGLGADVASALAYIHGRGIVHRDVKPSNVLSSQDGRTLLGDFGIARLVDATGLTATGMAVGTPAYLAPEQLQGGDVGPATDVYALGLVLLESLTGAPAFAGPHTEAALARLANDPPVEAVEDPPWRALLEAMTARDPAERPDAASIEARLGHGDPLPETVPALTEVTAVAPSPDPAPTPAAGVAAPRSRRGVVAAVAAVVLLLAAVALALTLTDTGDGSDPGSEAASDAAVPSTTTATTPPTTAAATTAPAAPATTAATTATTSTAGSCADLEAERTDIAEQKQNLNSLISGKDERDEARHQLDERRHEIDDQLRELDC